MAITPNAARRISQAVTTVERSIGSGSKLGLDPTTNHSSVIVKTPSGGIPARSGTTLGSASCTIQVVDKSNDSISDGSSIDVLNLSTTAVAGDTYINAIRDRAGNFIAETPFSSSIARIDVGPPKLLGSSDDGGNALSFRQSELNISNSQRIPLMIKDVAPFTANNFGQNNQFLAGKASNGIFESGSEGGNDHENARIIIKQPGTYSGAITLAYKATLYGNASFYLHESATQSAEFVTVDKSDGSGTASVLAYNHAPKSIIQTDYIYVSFYLMATSLNNKVFRNEAYSIINDYEFAIDRKLELDYQFRQRGEFTLPFIFSVDDSSFESSNFEPFELQLWGLDRHNKGYTDYDSTSTNLRILTTLFATPTYNSGYAKGRIGSWIEYRPELLGYNTTVFISSGGVTPTTG